MMKKMSGNKVYVKIPVLEDGGIMAITDKEKANILGKKFASVHSGDHLDQGSPSSVLEGRCPAEFSANPNQTHLKQLFKLLTGILETSRQVCWGKLELNSAGHRPSRIKFDDP